MQYLIWLNLEEVKIYSIVQSVKLLLALSIFTESWGDKFTQFGVQGFIHYELKRTEYKPNSKRSSGGIVMYIKESSVKPNSNVLYNVDNDDIVWVKFDNTNSVFISDLYSCLC